MHRVEPPLWIGVRGAPRRLLVAWLGCMVGVPVVATALHGALGGGGTLLVLATAGWLLARRYPAPSEALVRYHLDADEVIRMGPGAGLQRLPWRRCASYVATRHGVTLGGDGGAITLALGAGEAARVWREIFGRVVPRRAEELWRRHERAAVSLAPAPDPALAAVVWWAWTAALLVVAVLPTPAVAGLAVALAGLERLSVTMRRRWRTVVLQPGGVVVPGEGRRCFVPWDEVDALPSARGLEVRGPQGAGLVAAEVSDFMAAAAVVQLHAEVGFANDEDVSFRIEAGTDGLALVGEVEP